METVVWVLLITVAGGAVWAGRRLLLFPAGGDKWRYSLAPGREFSEARQRLHDVRLRNREVESEGNRKVALADAGLADIARKGGERVLTLERERADLLRPVRGELVLRLGELALYQCTLQFVREVPAQGEGETTVEVDHEVSLIGLSAEIEYVDDYTFIHVEWPEAKRSAGYPRAFDRFDVLRFANQIDNVAREYETVRRGQELRAAEITTEIQRVKDDTAAREEQGRREREGLLQQQHQDRAAADADWQKACAAWQKLTDRSPRR